MLPPLIECRDIYLQMTQSDKPSLPPMPDPAKLNAVIYGITFVKNFGRFLRWFEFAFGVINAIYAGLNFFVWNDILAGIINTLFSIGSFSFYYQLIPRRARRPDYSQRTKAPVFDASETPSRGTSSASAV